MGISTTSRVRIVRGFVPMLAGAALALAACGSDTDPVPVASTTTPNTSSVTTTTTETTTLSSTTAASPTATQGAATPVDAVEAWLRGEGYEYSGDCADAKLETDSGTWCSTLAEGEGDEQTYKVGRVFSQYKYSLELKKSGSTWSVADVDEIAVGP